MSARDLSKGIRDLTSNGTPTRQRPGLGEGINYTLALSEDGLVTCHEAGETEALATVPGELMLRPVVGDGQPVAGNYVVTLGDPTSEADDWIAQYAPLLEEDAAASAREIRVVIVDREPLVLRGLSSVFGAEPGFTLVGEASRGDQALALINALSPDIVVIDLRLPDMGGLAVIEELRRSGSPTEPVILTSDISEHDFLRAKALGVRGFLLKTMPPHLLVQCVRTVHAGDEFVERDTSRKVLSALIRRATSLQPPDVGLTEREGMVVELVAAGLSNREIAEKLEIGAGTVKSHLHSVYEKLGVTGRFALMRITGDRDAI